jgi:hypothetical protein
MNKSKFNIGDVVLLDGDDCVILGIRRDVSDSRNILVRDSYGSEFLVSRKELEGK